MSIDKRTLTLVSPVLSTVGATIGLLSALFGRDRSRTAVLSALLGTIGSAAWLIAALQDDREQVDVLVAVD